MNKKILIALLAGALVILWIGAFTDIDFSLARMAYDQPTHSFPWRHRWFAESFSHGVLKTALTVLAVAVVLPVAYDALRPFKALAPWWRVRLRVVALSAVLVPLTISLLKHVSASHCPWDLQAFGGTEQYVRLLQAALPNAPAGHCMPAGHASTALWLLSVMVFWLPHRPRMAALVGALMLALSFGVGWIQQLRGAHFLTHTLWSIWIACAIVSFLYGRMLRSKAGQGASTPV